MSPRAPRRTLLAPETQARRTNAYVVVPYVATLGAYQGPGWTNVLCDWSVPPGEDARTVRVVGCCQPGYSTRALGWYVVAIVEYQLNGLVRSDTFRWSCAGWSRLFTADAIRVSFKRYDQSGNEFAPTPPTNNGMTGWVLGAAVMDGPLSPVQQQLSVDCGASGDVFGTRIPVGATRVRLDVDTDYSLLYAGWGDDPQFLGRADNLTVLEDYAYFPDIASGGSLRQRYAAQMFADWRAVDDLAGMVAVSRYDETAPSRWRWIFETS